MSGEDELAPKTARGKEASHASRVNKGKEHE